MSYNILFPTIDDRTVNSFYKMNNTTKNAIISNLYFLLLTRKGERYYNPDFGTDLFRYLFEPNDSISEGEIKKSLYDDVKKYIPQVDITDFSFTTTDDNKNENTMNIFINFRINDGAFTEDGTIELNL